MSSQHIAPIAGLQLPSFVERSNASKLTERWQNKGVLPPENAPVKDASTSSVAEDLMDCRCHACPAPSESVHQGSAMKAPRPPPLTLVSASELPSSSTELAWTATERLTQLPVELLCQIIGHAIAPGAHVNGKYGPEVTLDPHCTVLRLVCRFWRRIIDARLVTATRLHIGEWTSPNATLDPPPLPQSHLPNLCCPPPALLQFPPLSRPLLDPPLASKKLGILRTNPRNINTLRQDHSDAARHGSPSHSTIVSTKRRRLNSLSLPNTSVESLCTCPCSCSSSHATVSAASNHNCHPPSIPTSASCNPAAVLAATCRASSIMRPLCQKYPALTSLDMSACDYVAASTGQAASLLGELMSLPLLSHLTLSHRFLFSCRMSGNCPQDVNCESVADAEAAAELEHERNVTMLAGLQRLRYLTVWRRKPEDSFWAPPSVCGSASGINQYERAPGFSIVRYCVAMPHKHHLSSNLFALTKLEHLDLTDNQVVNLPSEVTNLVNLKVLLLGNNKIERLPDSIGSLQALQVLDVRSNKLSTLPESIGQLTQLSILDLSANSLARFPDSLSALISLEQLSLASMLHHSVHPFLQLQILNPVSTLTKLKSLRLSSNMLLQLPDWIGRMSHLTALYLGNNDICDLHPLGVAGTNLTNLCVLDLCYNRFDRLPDSFTSLAQLIELDLSYAKLTKIPAVLAVFNNLRVLRLHSVYIEELECAEQMRTLLNLLHDMRPELQVFV